MPVAAPRTGKAKYYPKTAPTPLQNKDIHTYSRSPSLLHTRTHIRMHAHTHTRTRTRALPQSSACHWLSLARVTISHTHTHTQTQTDTHTHIHTHTLSLSQTHTHPHPYTHTHTLPLLQISPIFFSEQQLHSRQQEAFVEKILLEYAGLFSENIHFPCPPSG